MNVVADVYRSLDLSPIGYNSATDNVLKSFRVISTSTGCDDVVDPLDTNVKVVSKFLLWPGPHWWQRCSLGVTKVSYARKELVTAHGMFDMSVTGMVQYA